MSNHTKGHPHRLDMVCSQCIINKFKQYDKLLEFTKELSHPEIGIHFTYAEVRKAARLLLKEIGEIE
jgi:hypothetical protein